ncbi:MAG: Gfo/Idh/MocA family oxidoreductase [Chloroflexota bacterium]
MMWGVGIIGAGSYGAQHAHAIKELDTAQVVAASRTNHEALAEFTTAHGGAGYTDFHDLLQDDAVDIVMIATPHHLHTDVTIAAAQAGKHILLEKPIAHTPEDCQRIIDAVQAASVKFMVGHVNHFVPAYRVAKQLLESGEMGEVVHGIATMQKYWMVDNRRGWHLDRSTGGGVWLTVGIHPLDRMTWLIDSPVTAVSAQFGTRFHNQNADDTGMIFVRYANGAAGTVVSTGYNTGAPKHLTELTCSKGMLNIDYEAGVSIGRGEVWQTIPESIPSDDWMHESIVEEWSQFITAIESNTRSPVPADFAMHIMDVVFASEQSSQEKREISVTSTWER